MEGSVAEVLAQFQKLQKVLFFSEIESGIGVSSLPKNLGERAQVLLLKIFRYQLVKGDEELGCEADRCDPKFWTYKRVFVFRGRME